MDHHSQSKQYDIFISHSSGDQAFAGRLARELQSQGYKVWLDDWEILVGHNIVDEIYKGIANSKFVVVLLSKDACESEWGKEVFTSARMTEIEERRTVILPAKIEECEIPAPLNTKKYADFTKDRDFGFRELVTAIEQHPDRQRNNLPTPASAPIPNPPNFSELDQWRKNLLPEIAAAGFAGGQPFKDVLIGPVNGNTVNLEKTRLKPIVDSARVFCIPDSRVSPFPHPSTGEVRLRDGLRGVDTGSQYNTDLFQAFHFWQIDCQIRFLQRTSLNEDFLKSSDGNFHLRGRLAKSWTLRDITAPLMFARDILSQETRLSSLGVKLVWSGLKDRKLLEINPSRMRVFYKYQCRAQEWTFEVEITPGTDILTEARKAALDLFRLFGWKPQTRDLALLERDLEALANGVIPR